MKYFHINNIKFNYDLEFSSNSKKNYWKYNAPLIEYCETLGITIPHYCYHKNLSISGNCRMCLVELKNSPKPVVSCAMSAKSCLNNNEVYTNSPLVKKARENILEFLLLNHPLDCPICDQGGECDLQDQSFFFGFSKKRFFNFKRVVTDKNIGPIVKTVMTRCIHCTRCVRFASEIAGVEDMGMFGRGLHSEIGTYVTKTFQSELSGNVIDLCPVGALTAKPYPFVSRSWELKNINSIDFSDGFGTELQIFLKNNKIVKILPGFNKISNTTSWISDKTRFSFDGMFSPERMLKGFIETNNSIKTKTTWKILFNEIIYFLYFQDHLNKHFLKIHRLVLSFNFNISIEVLCLLLFLEKKYSFLKLKKIESNLSNPNFESDFTIDKDNLNANLDSSNICMLIGVNTRYESPFLNLKLRKRYLKGNFKIISLNSLIDLTFPITSIGTNLNQLKDISEGSHFLCQELINKKNPTILIGSEIFKRHDFNEFKVVLNQLKVHLNHFHNINLNINILSTSLNEAGIHYLNNFKKLTMLDVSNSLGLYCLNINKVSSNLKKILELKLLNYSNTEHFLPKILIEQNTGFINKLIYTNKDILNYSTYLNLPNNAFFESNGMYLTTDGILKKNIKFLSSVKQSKEDWQIIRKLFSYSKQINFLSNEKWNNTLSYNCKNFFRYKCYINFMFFASNSLSPLNGSSNLLEISKVKSFKNSYKISKIKFFKTPIKLWLDDFYLGGKDSYSQHSVTMIKCSQSYRKTKTNFSYIV